MNGKVLTVGLALLATAASQVLASGSCTFTVTNLTYSEGNTVVSVSYSACRRAVCRFARVLCIATPLLPRPRRCSSGVQWPT